MTSVSVVIPTYNRAALLEAAVDSVLAQTRPPDEVLIVDDGSTDDTEAVCRRFPEPVRYLKQPNRGVSAARNRGVREASGEWVAFLDSDDLWEPSKLDLQLAALEACPGTGWSITDCVVVDAEDRPVAGAQGLRRATPAFDPSQRSPDELFSETLARGRVEVDGDVHHVYSGDAYGILFYGNFVLPSTAVVRRDVFLADHGFDADLRTAEDTEFFHRLAARSPVVVVMSPELRWRTGHGERLTDAANTLELIEHAVLSNERAARLRDLTEVDRRRQRLGRRKLLLRLAYARLSLFERSGAREAIRSAWDAGAPRVGRSTGIFVASLLPDRLLRALHGLKKAAAGGS